MTNVRLALRGIFTPPDKVQSTLEKSELKNEQDEEKGCEMLSSRRGTGIANVTFATYTGPAQDWTCVQSIVDRTGSWSPTPPCWTSE